MHSCPLPSNANKMPAMEPADPEEEWIQRVNVATSFINSNTPFESHATQLLSPFFEDPVVFERVNEIVVEQRALIAKKTIKKMEGLSSFRFKDASRFSLKELRNECDSLGLNTDNFLEKDDFVKAVNGRTNACPICLEEFRKGMWVKRTACGHIFHKKCLLSYATDFSKTKRTSCIQCPFKCGDLSVVPPHILERKRKRE